MTAMDYPQKTLHWIGGKEVFSRSGEFFEKINPATGEVLSRVARGREADVAAALDHLEKGYEAWSGISAGQRAEILRKAVRFLDKRKEELAEIVALESGKSKKDALSEVGAAVKCGFFFAEEGAKLFEQEEILPSAVPGRKLKLIRQSIGIGALITPFNNPAAGVAWKIFPALLAGNAVILKSHEYTPSVAVCYAKILSEAGLPTDVISVVQGLGAEAGEHIVREDRVKFISFTGSLATGQHILKTAAHRLCKVSVETGGKNPFVVCDDADLDRAADLAVQSSFVDAGQRCAAASRIIVFKRVYDEFKKKFLYKARELKVGTENTHNYGAIISGKRMQSILEAISGAVSRGANLATGGRSLPGPGYFIEPTVLENVPPDDEVSQEEIFGPVVVLYQVESFEEALRLANHSKFKLTGAIHTRDKNRAQEFVKRFISGVVRVNGPTHGSEPHVPFGGVGLSGNGWREPGKQALDFYSEWKQVSED